MNKISQKELDRLIDEHERWLNDLKKGHELILINYDLSHLSIENRDLSEAKFCDCNMSLMKVKNCKLLNTVFSYSDFEKTLFECCDFLNTSFYRTNLVNSNFISCSLTNVNLAGANLSSAEIRDCKLENITTNPCTSFYSLQCPEEGSFIGFKKANIFVPDNTLGDYTVTNMNIGSPHPVIIKLQITEDSLRSSATSRKCRCSKAKVLSISYLDGTECSEGTIAHSKRDFDFTYKVGDILEIKNFNEDRWKGCTTGIHFFITREEAVNY